MISFPSPVKIPVIMHNENQVHNQSWKRIILHVPNTSYSPGFVESGLPIQMTAFACFVNATIFFVDAFGHSTLEMYGFALFGRRCIYKMIAFNINIFSYAAFHSIIILWIRIFLTYEFRCVLFCCIMRALKVLGRFYFDAFAECSFCVYSVFHFVSVVIMRTDCCMHRALLKLNNL